MERKTGTRKRGKRRGKGRVRKARGEDPRNLLLKIGGSGYGKGNKGREKQGRGGHGKREREGRETERTGPPCVTSLEQPMVHSYRSVV